MKNTGFTNLRKSQSGMTKGKNLVSQITEQLQNLPDLVSKVGILPNAVSNLSNIKRRFLKTLKKRKQKYRLALESLGWGTLADMLESALCGEKLNIWV